MSESETTPRISLDELPVSSGISHVAYLHHNGEHKLDLKVSFAEKIRAFAETLENIKVDEQNRNQIFYSLKHLGLPKQLSIIIAMEIPDQSLASFFGIMTSGESLSGVVVKQEDKSDVQILFSRSAP